MLTKRAECQIWNPNAFVSLAAASKTGRASRLFASRDQEGAQDYGGGGKFAPCGHRQKERFQRQRDRQEVQFQAYRTAT